MRPHADDEATLSPWADILTISVGAERTMAITHNEQSSESTFSVILRDRALLVMTRDMQNSWRHGIEADPEIVSPRVSLSFRHIDPAFSKSTLILGDSNTKNLQFGAGKGTFGRGMPGKRTKMSTLLDIPHPDVILSYSNVVLHVGINDLRNDRVNPMSMINRLKDICSYLSRRKGNLNIMLSSVLPTKNIGLNHKIYDYNCMLYELTKNFNIYFLNNYYLAGQDSKLLSRYENSETINDVHINIKGAALFSRAIHDRVIHTRKRW